VRCWTIKKNSKAPKAASVIHTDFERGFISAEAMPYAEFEKLGDDPLGKMKKKMMKEGKEYIV
jgi:ribosome-binding ATPase YchF (GTP1/OBG family)